MKDFVVVPTLTRDELIKHWLLHLAIECAIPLRVLFPFFWPTRNARDIPDVEPEDFARNLLELFDSGLILIFSGLEEDDVRSRLGVATILERFLALPRDAPQHRQNVHSTSNPALRANFELTTDGGATWEKVAKPDWSRYLAERSDFEVADFYSANRDLLTAYMGWYGEINEARILTRTVQWESVADSKIVYWKTLPIVHHAFCHLEVKPPTDRPEWLWDWYISATKWYREPWELPDWPEDRDDD